MGLEPEVEVAESTKDDKSPEVADNDILHVGNEQRLLD